LAPLRAPYREDSELAVLSGRFPMVPSLEEASGVDQVRWYTHFPNDPRVQGPDRTLDYLFHSPSLTRLDARVRRSDTLQISNHLPLAARFLLPH
ncbi:endonuclease/exonuclease/phosphatase family protein, partial [Pseudomonas aeruginosa]